MRNSLKITVISSPNFKNQEAVMITRLMEAGLEKFHLRKPEASSNEIASLLEEIPSVHHPKIIIHRKIELLEDYKLGGYHHRSDEKLKEISSSRSRSLHKPRELQIETDILDYVFLGPVFSSVSKAGYKPKMSLSQLKSCLTNHSLKKKRPDVYALGGIRKNKISTVIELGFDGVALLGSIWGKPDPVQAYKEFMKSIAHQRLYTSKNC